MKSRNKRGFTLIELLVAASLLTLVMAAAYTSFRSTLLIWRTGEDTLEGYRGARIALGMLAKDIMAIVPQSWIFAKGDEKEFCWCTTRPPLSGTTNDIPRLLSVRYFLKPDGSGRYKLVKEERPILDGLPIFSSEKLDFSDLVLGRAKQFELCEDVLSLRFTYYWTPAPDPEKPEKDTFSAAVQVPISSSKIVYEYGMPQAIAVTLQVFDPTVEGNTTSFTTWVVLTGSMPRVVQK